MKVRMVQLLQFSVELRPPGGVLVVCSVAGPVPCTTKDPAGYYFHQKALKQAGLLREWAVQVDDLECPAGKGGRGAGRGGGKGSGVAAWGESATGCRLVLVHRTSRWMSNGTVHGPTLLSRRPAALTCPHH